MVTCVLSSVVLCPYEGLVPYKTCELDGMLVVQVIVADVDVIPPAVTAEITGGFVKAD